MWVRQVLSYRIVAAAFLAIVAGCDQSPPSKRPTTVPSPQPLSRRLRRNAPPDARLPILPLDPEYLDAAEAVVLYEWAGRNRYADVDFVFVELEQQDPPFVFLSRFSHYVTPVLPKSLANAGIKEVSHSELGGHGLLVQVHGILRIDDDRIEVEGGTMSGLLASHRGTYRLERRAGKWKVVELAVRSIS
jgi:hypothetical protein